MLLSQDILNIKHALRHMSESVGFCVKVPCVRAKMCMKHRYRFLALPDFRS